MGRISQKWGFILLLIYLGCGVYLCVLVMDRHGCDSDHYFNGNASFFITSFRINPKGRSAWEEVPPWENDIEIIPSPEKRIFNRYCAGGYHGILTLIGTLLIGFTIVIYRLLIGTRTRVLKYIHMSLHAITILLFSLGIWCIYNQEFIITYPTRGEPHGIHAYVVYGIFCGQFILGAMVFTYTYPNAKLRRYFAPFHDVIGIWLFICCVACCISGRRQAHFDYLPSKTFYGVAYTAFSCILIIVVSPWFDWDLVGPV
ncbi:uncharacterized protein LOC142239036 [Haematobia irritans]|uniref:uncharacterized protein LOC142239036 n=1 Tax=Haematobia irritans TaxID=7368 RepID=UPI003F4F915A